MRWGALVRVMEADKLKIATGLPMAAALVSELKNFAAPLHQRKNISEWVKLHIPSAFLPCGSTPAGRHAAANLG